MNKVKKHFVDNKKLYIGIGVGSAVTAGLVIALRIQPNTAVSPQQKLVVLGKSRDVNQVLVNFVERSTPSRPIHLVGTSQYFNSISEAARVLDLDRGNISKNINGHIPNVKGYVFKLAGETAKAA